MIRFLVLLYQMLNSPRNGDAIGALVIAAVVFWLWYCSARETFRKDLHDGPRHWINLIGNPMIVWALWSFVCVEAEHKENAFCPLAFFAALFMVGAFRKKDDRNDLTWTVVSCLVAFPFAEAFFEILRLFFLAATDSLPTLP